MRTYWFEIVRCGLGRFSWLLVERDDERLVVLARGRERGKKKKVKADIARLRKLVDDADVIDATQPQEPYSLPPSTFHHLSDVLPLLVGDRWAPEDDDRTGYAATTSLRPRRGAGRTPTR